MAGNSKKKGSKSTAQPLGKSETKASSLPTARGKRKRSQEDFGQPPPTDNSRHDPEDQDDDDDDDELLEAAAKWARQDKVEEIKDKSLKSTEAAKARLSTSSAKSLGQDDHETRSADDAGDHDNGNNEPTFTTRSLHLTQLSFDTTEYDIRELFSEQHGCRVTSVRLVYDGVGRQAMFRGVAFVDVADSTSYQKALKLHRFFFKGRKINVRPTVTKEELENIVQRKQIQEQQRRKEQTQLQKVDKTAKPGAAKVEAKAAVSSPKSKREKTIAAAKAASSLKPRREKTIASAKAATSPKPRSENTKTAKAPLSPKPRSETTKTAKAASSPKPKREEIKRVDAPKSNSFQKKKAKTTTTTKTTTNNKTATGGTTTTGANPVIPDRKMTKKERNRRAAIITNSKRQRS